MSDEHEWVDDAVPGGIEIAHVVLEHLHDHGWAKTWEDCNGFRVCPRVRVWLDAYSDWDYEQVFLFRVWTQYPNDHDPERVEVTDHLAVFLAHAYGPNSRPLVEWRQEPKLFFEAGGEWGFDGMRWWVDWCQGIHEPSAEDLERQAQYEEHNDSIRNRDRQRAIALGLGPALGL